MKTFLQKLRLIQFRKYLFIFPWFASLLFFHNTLCWYWSWPMFYSTRVLQGNPLLSIDNSDKTCLQKDIGWKSLPASLQYQKCRFLGQIFHWKYNYLTVAGATTLFVLYYSVWTPDCAKWHKTDVQIKMRARHGQKMLWCTARQTHRLETPYCYKGAFWYSMFLQSEWLLKNLHWGLNIVLR